MILPDRAPDGLILNSIKRECVDKEGFLADDCKGMGEIWTS